MKQLKKLLNKLTSYLPTPLPVGMTEYNQWLATIIELTGPIADEMSLSWVISNEIMRLPSGKDKVPNHYFVKALRKYAANQIAAAKVIELKKQQEEKAAADTAPKVVSSGETQTT